MTTSITRKRQSAERRIKLEKLAEQVRAGTLKVRQASERERAQWQREAQERERRQANRRS
jgi:hypothetical protein